MKKLSTVFLMTVMFDSIVCGYEYSDYDWIINPANGHEYAITLDWSNWTQAKAWSEEAGGYLVVIDDLVENNWLVNNFPNNFEAGYEDDPWHAIAWIGLEYIGGDKDLSTSWRWVTGEPLAYDPPWWSASPHEIVQPDEYYAYLHVPPHSSSGTWWNSITSYPRGIIEIPEPAALILFGLGGLVLRRKCK